MMVPIRDAGSLSQISWDRGAEKWPGSGCSVKIGLPVDCVRKQERTPYPPFLRLAFGLIHNFSHSHLFTI